MLEHCREGEINCLFYIFGAFSFDRNPKVMNDINALFFIRDFTVRGGLIFPVNYTSEIPKLFEASVYIMLCGVTHRPIATKSL